MYRLMRLLMVGALVLLGTSAISTSADKSTAQQEFEDDPSMLGINCERWSVLIERSDEGLDLAGSQLEDNLSLEASWLLRADRALKEDALRLLLLRNRLLEMGLLKERSVRTTVWPRWIFEPPSATESPDTLAARLSWIGSEASKLTKIGCDIGGKKSKDPLFCSVD